MALNDAIDEMRAYAARGRLGEGRYPVPVLRLDVTARITRGAVALIKWQATNARELTLVISRPGFPRQQLRVPPRGRRELPDLPVGRHTVLLRARPMRQRGNEATIQEIAVIEVMHPRPIIEIAVLRRIVLGELLRLTWNIQNALRAEIITSQGSRQIGFEDTLEMRPSQCGSVQIVIRAVGRGGETEQRVTIDVVAPPVAIDVPAHITAEIGEDITIPYSVRGAAALSLKALDRDKPVRALPSSGCIEMDEVTESERLVLTATGHDGRKRSCSITVHVVPMAIPQIDDFLEILNRRA